MSNQTFEHDNFTVTLIGRTDNGIDGSDEYVQLSSIDGEPLTTEQIDQLFWEKWRYETQQEAGGYFCKSYSVFFHQYGNDRAVMCINHRYDV
jgi:hypothetical protein